MTAIGPYAAPNSEIKPLDDATTWTGTTGATWTSNGSAMTVTRYTDPPFTTLGALTGPTDSRMAGVGRLIGTLDSAR